MLNLFLIRHAKSSWDNPGLRDFNRPLNERGQHDGPRMAALLAATGIQPDLIVSSPAKRAFSTAQFFAEAFHIDHDSIKQEPGIYEALAGDLMRIISALPESASTVLLFGHNPTFTEVANIFSDEWIDNVPTCGIIHIRSSAENWRSLYDGNSSVDAMYFPKKVL